jgi:hypothetical protein
MIEREMGNVLLSGKSFFKQREWNTNVSYRVEFLFTRFAHRSEQFNKKETVWMRTLEEDGGRKQKGVKSITDKNT